MFPHLESRLAERGLKYSELYLRAVALECSEKSTAVCLAKTGVEKMYLGDREESNGDLVILVVRNKIPTTIMFRRSNQPFTPKALNVECVKYLED